MDEAKRNLKGSEKRDIFKRLHKELDPSFYATDADFCLVSKDPPGTVAYWDLKDPRDYVTFTEAIQYNEWMTHAPVFIVETEDPESGPFIVKRYLGANWRPEPPQVNWGEIEDVGGWGGLEEWERKLREEYSSRGGWKGNLRRE